MKTTDYIAIRIDEFPEGFVFTYLDFLTAGHNAATVIKALNRMAYDGKISKLSKGKFYKPQKSIFGELQPEEEEVIKDLLVKDGKIIGYVTGFRIYNQMALTTQVPNVIHIGRNESRRGIKRGMYTIAFMVQKNAITKENVPHLQLLDAIRHIKIIPDASIEFLCKRFLAILKEYEKAERNTLMQLAELYPPSTRALLGALLDELGYVEETEQLFNTLNPITIYQVNGAERILTTTKKWNIR